MVLSRVIVRNYQSLKDVEVELGPMTVIVGPSDTGKSALVRAIQAACFNQTGQDFITRGEKETSVLLFFGNDGVWWSKNGTKAKYELADNFEGPYREFTKFGTGVPEDIEESLGIVRLDVDGAKFTPQFAGQFDQPFLLGESAGRIARVVAKVTKLDRVLGAAAEARRDIGRYKDKQKDLEGTLEEKEQVAELLQAQVAEGKRLLSGYSKEYKELKGYYDFGLEARKKIVRVRELEGLLVLPSVEVSSVREQLGKVTEGIKLREGLHRYRELAKACVVPSFDSNTVQIEAQLVADVIAMTSRLAQLRQLNQSMVVLDNEQGSLKRERVRLLKELKNFEVCPSCGQYILEKV